RSVTVIGGALHERHERYVDDSFFKIVNYDVVHRDLEAIARLSPDIVILDEAQRIKNWRTRAAQAVKSIVSPYALVLTGTPLENRLEELHSIVSFVDQYRLGPLFRLLDAHQVTEPGSTKVTGYRNLSSISDTLKPVVLRRRKKDVQLQLPERVDRTYFVPMERHQLAIHSENRELVAQLVAKWRRYNFLTEADQRRLQVALLRMRMVCDNTFLVDHKTRHGAKVDEVMQVLDELLEDPEAKAVVFSEWTRMHDLIVEELERRDIGFVYLNGSVASTARGELVRRFREDSSVRVFLSTDAGNAGLNLQNASVIINVDLPWNPARLEQRIGRVHRLGQQRMVQVINFVAEGSIEHGMLSLLQFKKNLFEGVLDDGPDSVTFEGSRLSQFMRTVEEASSAVPEAAPVDAPVEDPAPAEIAAIPACGGPDVPTPDPMPPAESLHAGASAPRTATADSLTPLLQAGLSFVQELGGVLQAARSGDLPVNRLIERDEATGRNYLKLPVPDAEVMDKLVSAVGSLLTLLSPRRGE
ncbi:MAG: DEAD/DEAH box helicase, partial [Candidatus Xenobia bacterium]